MFGLFRKKKTAAPAKSAKEGSPKDAKAKTAAKKPVKAETQETEASPVAQPAPKTKTAVPTSLKAALAAMEDAIPEIAQDKPAPKVSAGAKLDKAREALAKKANAPMDRKALIEQALAIQQTQAKMLDKLPEATRNKLRDMALKAFVIDEPKSQDQKKKMN
jgi:hypothetical protein